MLSLADTSGSPIEHAHCSMGVNLNVIKTLSRCFFQKLFFHNRAIERDSRTQTCIVNKEILLPKNDLEIIVRVYAQGGRTSRAGRISTWQRRSRTYCSKFVSRPNSHDSDEERGSLDSSSHNSPDSWTVRVDTARNLSNDCRSVWERGWLLLVMSCLRKESMRVSAHARANASEICRVSRSRSSIRF